jgi:hypothetical protein
MLQVTYGRSRWAVVEIPSVIDSSTIGAILLFFGHDI